MGGTEPTREIRDRPISVQHITEADLAKKKSTPGTTIIKHDTEKLKAGLTQLSILTIEPQQPIDRPDYPVLDPVTGIASEWAFQRCGTRRSEPFPSQGFYLLKLMTRNT
ncbi:hypothetical protein PGT21_025723 [Puccinia graminis f. sp. tritici]|uniref:Uncharacterized protein n=1 Tax=Puccinia graminis f. sp. tritici TaxID=56615 RepID=A0A5B0P7X8_PUCGR|nr:hypothetical protein PGT21_025723 [Puccinia graminis f. sp. tritici]